MRVVRLIIFTTCIAVLSTASAVNRTDLSIEDRIRVKKVTQVTRNFDIAEKFEAMQGGSGTSRSPLNRDAFSQPQSNISFADREQFSLGNGLFRKLWVSSPATTQVSDGLGPLFNARSCQSCHVKDGRGHLPVGNEAASSFLLQLGWFDSKSGSWNSDKNYGKQLQSVAVPGHLAEAVVQTSYQEIPVKFADGEVIMLRKPSYELSNLAYGEMGERTQLSPKIAPQMIGMGLLASISEEDILNNVDETDRDKDDISGRASWVSRNGQRRLGRFGLKATQVDIRGQTAGAFFNDMGLSTSLHPINSGECTSAQTQCLEAPHGEQSRLGEHEVPDPLLQLVTFYSENLAVPVRRNVGNADVLRGKSLFYNSGCTSCHVPKYVTRRDAADEQHRFQLIWPYSDLLLHDMGDQLADGLGTNAGATGNEWRTPPLWGIGLTQKVNSRATYLHDGRARTLLEAVMWHGGEAAESQKNVTQMSAQDRAALIIFLESL